MSGLEDRFSMNPEQTMDTGDDNRSKTQQFQEARDNIQTAIENLSTEALEGQTGQAAREKGLEQIAVLDEEIEKSTHLAGSLNDAGELTKETATDIANQILNK